MNEEREQQVEAVKKPLFFQGAHRKFFIWWAILFGFLILQLIFSSLTLIVGENIVENGLNIRHVSGKVTTFFGSQDVEMDIIERVTTGYNVLSQGEAYSAQVLPNKIFIIIGIILSAIVVGVWALTTKKRVQGLQKWLLRAVTLFAVINLIVFAVVVIREYNYVQSYVDAAPEALAKMKELVEKSGGVLEIENIGTGQVSLSQMLGGEGYSIEYFQEGQYNLDIVVSAKINFFVLILSAISFIGTIVAASQLKKLNKEMKMNS